MTQFEQIIMDAYNEANCDINKATRLLDMDVQVVSAVVKKVRARTSGAHTTVTAVPTTKVGDIKNGRITNASLIREKIREVKQQTDLSVSEQQQLVIGYGVTELKQAVGQARIYTTENWNKV